MQTLVRCSYLSTVYRFVLNIVLQALLIMGKIMIKHFTVVFNQKKLKYDYCLFKKVIPSKLKY